MKTHSLRLSRLAATLLFLSGFGCAGSSGDSLGGGDTGDAGGMGGSGGDDTALPGSDASLDQQAPLHEALSAPVQLGSSGNYVILAKTAISTVPASVVTGDIGVSPA